MTVSPRVELTVSSPSLVAVSRPLGCGAALAPGAALVALPAAGAPLGGGKTAAELAAEPTPAATSGAAWATALGAANFPAMIRLPSTNATRAQKMRQIRPPLKRCRGALKPRPYP